MPCNPDYFDEKGLDNVVGVGGNDRQKASAKNLMCEVRQEFEVDGEANLIL
ncbi:MAG: hypothetical protein OXE78_07910 [Gammaproteobacteria bacterium]|nr:hypothetical protein [Gammaproteobacteria bacterium]MCY4358350.1 hypothetical protein [Gammaproteobacteria bacterium]